MSDLVQLTSGQEMNTGGLVGRVGVCPKCGMLHTGSQCWPYPNVTYTYVQHVDLSQIPLLITEMRETRQALERFIKLIESWQGDNR